MDPLEETAKPCTPVRFRSPPPSMNEPADIAALLGRPGPRFRSLRAVGREWRHHARLQEAFGRHGPAGSIVVSMRAETVEETPDEGEEVWRLWIDGLDRKRAEFALGMEMMTVVFRGDTWWSWSPRMGRRTNGGRGGVDHGIGPGETLIDPASAVPVLDLHVLDQGHVLDRDVWRVRAVPAGDPFAQLMGLYGLGVGADEYELLVDAERGFLVRVEARLEGQPFRVVEITELTVNEPIPPDTFVPEPSDGAGFEQFAG
jgi:hypothetical protein